MSDTDEIARREARPHIEAFYNKFLRMPIEMLLPPGYLSLASMAVGRREGARGPRGAASQTIEELAEKGMIICGSPDSVRAATRDTTRRRSATASSSPMMQFGTLPHDMTKRSMELFATQGDAAAASHRRGAGGSAGSRGRVTVCCGMG